MILVNRILLASLAALWLAACGSGSGGGSQDTAESEGVGNSANTDATGQTKPEPSNSISKGESAQVDVNTDAGQDSPSLTLSRLGNNKLTWNEVVKAGASYLVFERTDRTDYDFNQPIQSLDDVVTLSLKEKPGTHCYLIRAKTKDRKITVDSNEICIERPLPEDHDPVLAAFTEQTVVATETLSLTAKAEDPDQDTLSFACVLNCPAGLSIDETSGLITWRPQIDQIGDANPIIQVQANGRTVTADLRILVLAPQMQIQHEQLIAISGETVKMQPTLTSNLQGPYQWSLTQSAGPQVSTAGQDGQWTFTAPVVDERRTLSFDVKAGNGLFATQETVTVLIDPQPVAPSVDIGPDRVARSPLTVSANVSSNARTLSWKALSGPGLVTFSAADAASTNITADTDGIYEIELTASNSVGQSTRASFRLTWDTKAPEVEAGEDASSSHALSRAALVQGAHSLTWTKISGPGSLQFAPAHSAATIISASEDGDYVIQLTAEDEAGNAAADSFTWHFDATAPSVTVGEPILTQSRSQALSASISDDAVSIQWKKISGPLAVSFAPDDQRNTMVTLGGDGVYILEVTAVDALGNSASAQQQITSDTLPPQIQGVSLGSVLSDGYLNPIEKSKGLPLVEAVQVQDSSQPTLAYRIVGSSTACTSRLLYNADIPRSDDASISRAGTYKICVKATDSMNLNAYGASANFIYDTTVVSVQLSELPANPTRMTSLQASVSGSKVTHYRSKLGPVASTDCGSIAQYGDEVPVTTPITDPYGDLSDGELRLCVIGRTASGNWQDLSLAYRYDWTLDRAMPGDPGAFHAVPMVERIRFSWDAAENADSYLIIRSEEGIVTWTPTPGESYTVGSDLDGGTHEVVAISSGTLAYDESAKGGTSYHYALFPFDKALNYNMNPARTTASPVEAVSFSKADGFDRLVRVVLPIQEGEHKGKILVGGDFLVYRQNPAVRLLRLNADLTLDTSFKAAVINSSVYSMALASDGSIYIAGSFTRVDNKVRNRLARLTSSGALDESFNPAGFNNTVMTLALSHDESRVYAGGSFTALTTTPATPMNRLAALHSYDGSLDTAFVLKHHVELNRTGFNSTVWTILPEPGTSHILVGGQFTDYGGVAQARLVKLDETGEIDSSLNPGSGFNNTVVTLKMDSRQRLYVGGSFSRYRGSSYYARFVRLKPDGTPDADFSKGQSSSPRFNSTVYAMELDENNQRVYVAGSFTLYGSAALNRLARLSTVDASLDTSWTTGTNGTLQTLGLSDDGRLIGGGNFQRYGGESTAFFFAASGINGALDTSSPRGSNLNSYVYASTRIFDDPNQPHETVKYILAGSFTTYNGETVNRLVKLDRQGNRDTSFNSQVTNGNIYAIAWDETEKKLYVGGTFTQVNGVPRLRIARLHADGSLDESFAPDGFNSDVYAIALATLPNSGQRVIYVGGKFTSSGTSAAARMVRLASDGKADANFVTGSGFDNNVTSLAVVPFAGDHAVFVGGSFTKYNSSQANAPRLVKLSSDGSLAPGFEPGSGFNGSVQALVWVPSEEALYVGGAFSRYQATIVANRIAKLDSTGGMAAGFNSSGFNSTVYALNYDADNDVVWAGGAFTSFRGVTQGRMAAMARDGSRIAAFHAPIGFNSNVRAITSSYWGVVAGGQGSSYEGDICGFVARLHVNATMD
jgi:uncharacterized delta-60 repeat protein